MWEKLGGWNEKPSENVNNGEQTNTNAAKHFGYASEAAEKNFFLLIHASCFNVRLSVHSNRCFVVIAIVMEFSRIRVEIQWKI